MNTRRAQPHIPPPVYPKPQKTWHIEQWAKKNGYLDAHMELGEPLRPRGSTSHWSNRPADPHGNAPLLLIAYKPTITGGQIIRGTQDSVNEWWQYDTLEQARDQYAFWWNNWKPNSEPEGWVKHGPSNRRRPDGDPNQEYIAP